MTSFRLCNRSHYPSFNASFCALLVIAMIYLPSTHGTCGVTWLKFLVAYIFLTDASVSVSNEDEDEPIISDHGYFIPLKPRPSDQGTWIRPAEITVYNHDRLPYTEINLGSDPFGFK